MKVSQTFSVYLNYLKVGVVFFAFLSFFASLLHARTNPFEPEITPKEGIHSHKELKNEILKNIDVELPSTARIVKKVSITYQNIDGTESVREIEIEKSIDWHYPLRLSQNAIGAQYTSENRFSLGAFEFNFNENSLFIATKRKNLRHFLLPTPSRIVLDFNDLDKALNENLAVDKKYFKSIALTSHDDFYRITLELDGQYDYDLQAQNDGYLLRLK